MRGTKKTTRRQAIRRSLRIEGLERKLLMAGDMTNPVNPLDVNADNQVTAIDALTIVNYMGRMGSAAEGEAVAAPSAFVDTNADGRVSALDALQVVNAIAEGEVVPSPAADLVPTSINYQDLPTRRLTINFENNGDLDISRQMFQIGELRIFQGDQLVGEPILLGSVLNPLVDIGQGDVFPVVANDAVRNLPDGVYRLEVMADPDNSLPELSEDNTLSQTITVGQGQNNPVTLPVVSITPSVPNITEGGTFTVTATRTGSNANAISVPFVLSGTATIEDFTSAEGPNVNFTDGQSGTFSIPAGQNSVTLTVQTLDDSVAEPTETVAVTLSAGTGFTVDSSLSTVSLVDNDGGSGGVRERLNIPGVSFRAGSSPRLRANISGATVNVTTSAAGTLTFSAGLQSETIAIRNDLRIEASGGGNTIIFDGAVIPDDLIIDLAGANHTVVLRNTRVGDDFIFDGSGGTDVVILDGNTRIGDDLIVKGKDGADALLVNNAVIEDDFFFYGKDGTDFLGVDGVRIGDDAIVRMGDDSDAGSFANAAVRDVADIEGDRGLDVLFAADSVSARRLRPDEFEGTIGRADVAGLIDQLDSGLAGITLDEIIDQIVG